MASDSHGPGPSEPPSRDWDEQTALVTTRFVVKLARPGEPSR